MIPIEAAAAGDTQVLVARFPGRPGEPVIAIDGLTQAPDVDSLVVSTEIRLTQPLPSVRELQIVNFTPLPPAEALANLTGLRTLYAPSAVATRPLAVEALAPGLARLSIHRRCLPDVTGISRLHGLRSLRLSLYPGDSVAPVGQLTELVRLSIDASQATGWRALTACEQLEDAHLEGLTGANLRPYASWAHLRRLAISGRGLRSLAGIDKLPTLEVLELEMMGVDDLTPLAALPRLRSLRLIGLKAAHDLSPLADLTTLEQLEVSRAGIEETDIVHVSSLRPLAELHRLEEVTLFGTIIDDGDLAPLTALPRLRRLALWRAGGPVVDELRARPGLDLTVEPGPAATAIVVHGLPIRNYPDGDWYLRADLTERLNVETNYDAEDILQAAVANSGSGLAGRLSFDTEAGAVTISAADQNDLHTLATIISRLTDR
jgi:hypothetical protein